MWIVSLCVHRMREGSPIKQCEPETGAEKRCGRQGVKKGGTYAGAALQDARRNKERTYPELLQNRRCRLVVLGIEVGGRWSNEASNFIRMLANARARSSPPALQAATRAALVSRRSALLTHAAGARHFLVYRLDSTRLSFPHSFGGGLGRLQGCTLPKGQKFILGMGYRILWNYGLLRNFW